jgi:hypothetical protein
MKIIKQTPTGTRKVPAFVDYVDGTGELKMIDHHDYPPNPRADALRELRVKLGVGLRAAAKAMGLSAVELAEIERGESMFAHDSSWAYAEAAIREVSS